MDCLVMSDAGGVLMNAHNRGVAHLDGRIMSTRKRFHDPAPDASPTPANEAVVAGGIWAEALRQIARHGAPDRNTQKMPLRTRRSFTRGTPRGLFGSIDLMAAHS
jgi:hypothetical protein